MSEVQIFIVLVLVGLAVIGARREKSKASGNAKPAEPSSTSGTVSLVGDTAGNAGGLEARNMDILRTLDVRRSPIGTPEEIAEAWGRADYDRARFLLQKWAYGMVSPGVKPEDKRLFTEVMANFAADDPLYHKLMGIILPKVTEQPGILQSQLIKSIEGYDVEHIRYVLYFAHELGELIRFKKGNTYMLFIPGQEMPELSKA